MKYRLTSTAVAIVLSSMMSAQAFAVTDASPGENLLIQIDRIISGVNATAMDVSARLSDGVVILDGHVESHAMRRALNDKVAALPGVVAVADRITTDRGKLDRHGRVCGRASSPQWHCDPR